MPAGGLARAAASNLPAEGGSIGLGTFAKEGPDAAWPPATLRPPIRVRRRGVGSAERTSALPSEKSELRHWKLKIGSNSSPGPLQVQTHQFSERRPAVATRGLPEGQLPVSRTAAFRSLDLATLRILWDLHLSLRLRLRL